MPIPNEKDVSYPDQAEIDSGDIAIGEMVAQGSFIYTGGVVTAQGTPDGTVAVSSGTCRLGASDKTITGGNVSVLTGGANPDGTTALAADSTNARFSLITFNASSQLGVIHGTAAALSASNDGSYLCVYPAVDQSKIILAAVFIPPAATTIATSQISTKRIPGSTDMSHDKIHVAAGTNHVGWSKGSIVVGTGTDVATQLAVGSNTQVLTADSAQGSGVKWATPAAGLATDTLWAAKGDLVVATANDAAGILTAPTQRGEVLGADAAGNVAWAPMMSGPVGVRCWDEMDYGTANITVAATPLAFGSTQFSGTIARLTVASLTGTASHPGISAVDTGTDTTGLSAIQTQLAGMLLGTGRHRCGAWVQFPTASDGTNRFELTFGFVRASSGLAATDGCFFTYRDNVNSGKWQATTINASTATNTDTTITASTATWYLLEVEVNAAATSVDFLINGTVRATNTTNIPKTAGHEVGCVVSILKSLGGTARRMDIDARYLEIDFTTAR